MFSKRARTNEIEEIDIKREFRNLESNFVIEHSNLAKGIGPIHKLNLIPGKTAFTLQILANGGFAVLKDINFEDGFEHIFHISIESPEVSNMKVFYRTSSKSKFGMIPPKRIKLKAGLNDVYFKIRENNLLGTMRIDPGSEIGEYVVTDLEIRSRKLVR